MRKLAAGGMCLAVAMLVSGCSNIHPLYGESNNSAPVVADLASVAIPEPDTRLAQIVRNDLISTMRPAGTAQPDRYTLALDVKSQEDRTIESTGIQRVLRRTIRLNVFFALHEQGTGKIVYQGKTFSQASYDDVGQPFADLQAKENAVERAAHEVSLDIRTRLAAHFAG